MLRIQRSRDDPLEAGRVRPFAGAHVDEDLVAGIRVEP
jgi:hypothetical protein